MLPVIGGVAGTSGWRAGFQEDAGSERSGRRVLECLWTEAIAALRGNAWS